MHATPWTIAHATDLRPEGGVAFAHGVALAERTRSRLVSVHALAAGEEKRMMPDANVLLSRWKHVDPKLDHETLEHSCCEDPVDTLLDAMRRITPDLIVVGTHQRTGMQRFMSGSVAESLALNTKVPTLFLPIGERGFVDPDTGAIALKRVLIPAADEAAARTAANQLLDLVERLDARGLEVYVMHVGSQPVSDDFVLPPSDRVRWILEERPDADLASQVRACITEHAVDLVVMATHGHDSVLDALRGSQTERVVRSAPVPVLSVPLR